MMVPNITKSDELSWIRFNWDFSVQQWLVANAYPKYKMTPPSAHSGAASIKFEDSETAAVFRLKYGT